MSAQEPTTAQSAQAASLSLNQASSIFHEHSITHPVEAVGR